MTIVRVQKLDDLPDHVKGGVVAIGNFDGVHLGHQSVLCAAVNEARVRSVPAIVLTFEPHPRTFFTPDKPVFRLTDATEKAVLLEALGFDCVVEHPFDASLSNMPAEAFVKEILVAKMRVCHVVTGYDFQFGKGREGTPEFLCRAGEALGFSTKTVEAFDDGDDEVISSSRIRDCLAKGNLEEAGSLLGYVYHVRGVVTRGKQIGRTMGYPTANLALSENATIAHGIYAVQVELEDGTLHDGVASYGRRPTFDNGAVLLETFIFDFEADLYGQQITVYLHRWLRGEEKFESAEALVEQMDRDSTKARLVLAEDSRSQPLMPTLQC